MPTKSLAVALLVWAALGVGSASAEKLRILNKPPAAPPPVVAEPTDPSEPPVQVEVSHGDGFVVKGGVVAVAGRATTAEVRSGARGTTIHLSTQGSYSGSASLAFKNSAPPMRFTVKLSQVPKGDLQGLTLTSGSLSLSVGGVGPVALTKYFDTLGRPKESPNGATYTVTARRGDNGQVEVELKRAPGAALGKTVTVGWHCQPMVHIEKLGFKRLGG